MPKYLEGFFSHTLTKRKAIHFITDTNFWKYCPRCRLWYEYYNWDTEKLKPSYCGDCRRKVQKKWYSKKEYKRIKINLKI